MKILPHSLGQLRETLLDDLFAYGFGLLLQRRLQLLDLRFEGLVRFLRLGPFLGESDLEEPFGRRLPVIGIEGRLQHGAQAVIVALRDGIVLMVVATRAPDRQSHDRGAQYVDLIGDHIHAFGQRTVRRRIGAVGRHPQKPGGGQSVDRLLRSFLEAPVVNQFVAGELFSQKAVVGLVLIEGANDRVSIAPRVRTHLVGVDDAFRIRIAGQVKPVLGPPFAVMRRREQAVDHSFVCVRAVVVGVLFHLGWRRRHADQIDVGPSHQVQAARLGGEPQTFLFELAK